MSWFKRKPKSTTAAPAGVQVEDAKVKAKAKAPRRGGTNRTVIEYLPDADEIERSPVPRYAQWTLHILVVAVVSFIVWACVSRLDEVVTAEGHLTSPLPNVVVQPLETSIVKTVDARIGQVVKKGQALVTQAKGLEAELSGEMPAFVAEESPDQKLQTDLLAERRASYRAQELRMYENAAKLKVELNTNRNDQQLVLARLQSVREIEAMQEKMVAQKYGTPLQLLEAKERTKEVERDLEQAVSREQSIRRELAALDAEKLGFEKNWRQKAMEDLLAVTRERDGIVQQLQKADRRSNLVTLYAPMDAVVLEVAKLSPGSIVQGAQTFFTLVPLNTKLEAEVQINSMDVGYIKPGAKVHLELDAFPFQRHGMLEGRVRTISEDAFKRDSNAKGALDAYYVARIDIESNQLRNMIDSSRLLPGMTLSAEVVVGKHSIISYLAWPLTKGLDEAIREPK